jgi:hypothetical protein
MARRESAEWLLELGAELSKFCAELVQDDHAANLLGAGS